MLELIDIGIENATAFRISGKISEKEMSSVLSNAKEKTAEFGKIVIYEEIQSFEGIELSAIAEKFRYLFDMGISNLTRIAIVTDKGWIQKIAEIEDNLFKQIEIKCFSFDEKALAIAFLEKAQQETGH